MCGGLTPMVRRYEWNTKDDWKGSYLLTKKGCKDTIIWFYKTFFSYSKVRLRTFGNGGYKCYQRLIPNKTEDKHNSKGWEIDKRRGLVEIEDDRKKLHENNVFSAKRTIFVGNYMNYG